MSREWFNKDPGIDVSPSQNDPTMMVIGTLGPGDVVRVPSNVPAPIAGSVVTIKEVEHNLCPMCVRRFGSENQVRVYSLVEVDDWRFAECNICTFVWFHLNYKAQDANKEGDGK